MGKKKIIKISKHGITFNVELMAKNGKYMMVRRSGCMPFVCYETDVVDTKLPKYSEDWQHESRDKAIAQNGNTGIHYDELKEEK